TGGLPRASFRFHVAMNTLAFGYVLTATRSHSGLSPVRVRPCWANIKSGTRYICPTNCIVLYILYIPFQNKQQDDLVEFRVVLLLHPLNIHVLSDRRPFSYDFAHNQDLAM